MWMMLNSQLVKSSDASVSVFDHGFMYGFGLFETLRVYDGKPFLLDQHFNRLSENAIAFGIEHQLTITDLHRQIQQLLEANVWTNAYIRISLSAGEAPIGLPDRAYDRPTLIIYCKPLSAMQPFPERPSKALQLLETRRNSPEGDVRAKSFHYLNNILGKQECLRYDWCRQRETEGLFLNGRDDLAEGLVSNLFFCKGNKLFTPSISTGILPGITRAVVLELARLIGLDIHEGNFKLSELEQADELFVTNSIQELVAVDTLFYPDGSKRSWVVGGITTLLAEQFDKFRQGLRDEPAF